MLCSKFVDQAEEREKGMIYIRSLSPDREMSAFHHH